MAGLPDFWIAGVVRDGAFSMLTTALGPAVGTYHARQTVVLPPGGSALARTDGAGGADPGAGIDQRLDGRTGLSRR